MSRGFTPNVLLLGISYPDVEGHMREHGYDEDILIHKDPSVEQAVECVRRGILTEMDARDLARCIATEQCGNGLKVYTVSKEVGGVYREDRHVYANFNNSRGFCNKLIDSFGKDIQFQQVILDYYWMPTGWLVTRWAKSLFQNTLPDLVRYQLLAYPGTRSRRPQLRGSTSSSGDDNNNPSALASSQLRLEEGVVFLPFCAHVCKELVGANHILSKYYAITFVKKDELPGHSLWRGTMGIDGDVMQHRLGKRLDQEEIYCTFQPKDIYESMDDSHIKKDDVMQMLLSIDDFENIRMIRLRPLRQHEPPSIFKECLWEPEVGGFVDLDLSKGARLLKEYRRRKKSVPPPPVVPVVTSAPTTEEETESDSDSDTDTVFESDSSSSEEEEGDDDDDDDEGRLDQIKFSPDDPDRIPEVVHYFPHPALDLVTYMCANTIMNNDDVMNTRAETWGAKVRRKKNRKKGISKKSFEDFIRRRKGYMSSCSRLPDVEEEDKEGYNWTLTVDGWELTLVGDAPGAEYETKIANKAKYFQNLALDVCHILLEMRNPGMKSYSRACWGEKVLSCYQIPKRSILLKIEAAKQPENVYLAKRVEMLCFPEEILREMKIEAAKQPENVDVAKGVEMLCKSQKILRNIVKLLRTTDLDDEENDKIVPIEDLSVPAVYEMDSISLLKHLEAYEHQKIPKRKAARQRQLVKLIDQYAKESEEKLQSTGGSTAGDSSSNDDDNEKDKTVVPIFDQFAEFVSNRLKLSDECQEVTAVVIEESLPPMKLQSTGGSTEGDSSSNDDDDEKDKTVVPIFDQFVEFVSNRLKLSDECQEVTEVVIEESLPPLEQQSTGGSTEGDSSSNDDDDEKDKTVVRIFDQFAEFVSNRLNLSDECQEVTEVVIEESLPPFKPKSNNRYLPFDLGEGDNFPVELYRLLEKADDLLIGHIISWNKGKSFKVYDEKAFEEKVLAHCCSKSAESFDIFKARVLSFGFSIVETGSRQGGFEHELFRRGSRRGVMQIHKTLGIVSYDEGETTTFEGRYHLGRTQLFPFHLYGLLTDAEKLDLTSVIAWRPDGKSFKVHDRDTFESSILPQCSGTDFKLFMHTLVRFGFTRISKNAYRHPNFLRGETRKLLKIVDASIPTCESASNVQYDFASTVSFVSQLHHLLDDARNKSWERVISWQAGGIAFGVYDRTMFEMMVLRKYSNVNYKTFATQLKEFGFEETAEGGYRHANFVRGRNAANGPNPMPVASPPPRTKSPHNKMARSEDSKSRTTTPRPMLSGRTNPTSSTNKRKEEVLKPTKDYNGTAGTRQFSNNLYALLEDEAANGGILSCVHWRPDGKSFEVTDKDAFTEQFLQTGRIIQTCAQFDSFERTLLSFGFEKMKTRGTNHHRYGHYHFVRGLPNKLWLIELLDKTSSKPLDNDDDCNQQVIVDDDGDGEADRSSSKPGRSSKNSSPGIPKSTLASRKRKNMDSSTSMNGNSISAYKKSTRWPFQL